MSLNAEIRVKQTIEIIVAKNISFSHPLLVVRDENQLAELSVSSSGGWRRINAIEARAKNP